MITFIKDPDATLDYTVDWSQWLQPGERISTVSWNLGGLGPGGESNTETHAVKFITGGTAGTDYTVRCRITTTQARTEDRSFIISVQER